MHWATLCSGFIIDQTHVFVIQKDHPVASESLCKNVVPLEHNPCIGLAPI